MMGVGSAHGLLFGCATNKKMQLGMEKRIVLITRSVRGCMSGNVCSYSAKLCVALRSMRDFM